MRQSMRKKMLLLYIGLAVLLLLVTVICNYEGIVNLNRQMNDLDQSVLKEYAAQTAANLSAVESNIQSFTSFDNDVASMQYLDDEAESLFATTRVLRRMKGDAIEYPDMSCEFLYTMYKENTLIVRGEKQSYEEKRRLDRAIADICKDTTKYASLVWNNYQIEGNNYLLYGCQMDDNYFAILIRPEELTQIPFAGDEQQNVSCLSLGTVAAFALLWTAVSELTPLAYIRFFMSPTPAVLEIAPAIIRTYALSFLLLPLNVFSTYYFQAILRTKTAFWISIARGVLLSGALIFLLPAVGGADAIWLAMPVTETAVAIFTIATMIKTKNLIE